MSWPRALSSVVVLACAVPAAADLADVKGRGGLRVLVVGVRSGDEFFAPAGAQPGFDTSEVFPTRNVVLTRRPHRLVRTIGELREEKVGTVKGTSLAEAVAAAGVPPAHVDGSVPSGALPDALKSGQVSAVVLGVENAISAQRADPALQLGLFLGPPTSLAYGVRKGDAELLKALDEHIENLRRTPTWSRLVVKYFGERAPDVLKKARTESTTP